MSGMLNECVSLEELNFSDFDARKTKFMTGIFAGFSSLKFLDILNLYIKKIFRTLTV